MSFTLNIESYLMISYMVFILQIVTETFLELSYYENHIRLPHRDNQLSYHIPYVLGKQYDS